MDDQEAFGRLLRRLRKAHPQTQAALASQATCAIDTIKRIEAGVRRPSRQLAAQFADCLGLACDLPLHPNELPKVDAVLLSQLVLVQES